MMEGMAKSVSLRIKRVMAPVAAHVPLIRNQGAGGSILYYHAIGNQAQGLAVSLSAFHAQMRLLAERYQVVPLAQLVKDVLGSERPEGTKPLVAVTFDDGFASVVNLGLPVLQEFGVSATIFAVTGRFGVLPDWMGRTPPPGRLVTIAEAERWVGAGMSIESHTVTHANLTTVTQTQLDHELAESRELLRAHFGCGAGLSYPWGRNDARERAAAQAAGYDYAVAIAWKRRHTPAERFALARMPVAAEDRPRDVALKLQGGYDWLRVAARVRGARGRARGKSPAPSPAGDSH